MVSLFPFAMFGFNPRTYMRCDYGQFIKMGDLLSFNPRTYMRCDSRLKVRTTTLTMFQSTHLHEVRQRGPCPLQENQCFNPRTYMRCDLTPP